MLGLSLALTDLVALRRRAATGGEIVIVEAPTFDSTAPTFDSATQTMDAA